MELDTIYLMGTIRKIEASSDQMAMEAFKIFIKKIGFMEKINSNIKPPFNTYEISLMDEDKIYYYLQMELSKTKE